MGNIITHFMWGYQPHYRINQECNAKRVFERLDPRFKPEIFLVGILAENRVDRFPACVEPEDGFWILSERFNDVAPLAQEKAANDPENQIFQSHPIAQESHDSAIQSKALRDVIEEKINEHDAKPHDYYYSVSIPTRVASYMVCVVLGLQESIRSEYYSLELGEVPLHEYRSISVSRSLIDATIRSFLSQAAQELLKPDAGKSSYTPSVEEILRIAAADIIGGIVWKVDDRCIAGMHGLFEYFNMIASLRYEKSAGSGRFVLARKDHPALSTRITFLNPTRLSSRRSARKLLELASEDIALHTNSEEIYGLVEVDNLDLAEENLFTIRVVEHHHWELCHGPNVLMVVKYGIPSLPMISFNDSKLRHDLKRIFQSITEEDVQWLIQLVQQAEKERHGTMLVISEDAESEAHRLATQSTPIIPCKLTPNLLRHLTPIDGAILISPQGVCHAIGTILDGKATEIGEPGRGARFNSALRYVQSSSATRCLAVVCSEDGGIDFVPNLHPAIKKSKIVSALKELEMVNDAKAIPWKRYNKAYEWLNEHRFYLLKEHCEVANTLIEKIERRLDNEEKRAIRIVRHLFSPNPAMDESMFYLDE